MCSCFLVSTNAAWALDTYQGAVAVILLTIKTMCYGKHVALLFLNAGGCRSPFHTSIGSEGSLVNKHQGRLVESCLPSIKPGNQLGIQDSWITLEGNISYETACACFKGQRLISSSGSHLAYNEVNSIYLACHYFNAGTQFSANFLCGYCHYVCPALTLCGMVKWMPLGKITGCVDIPTRCVLHKHLVGMHKFKAISKKTPCVDIPTGCVFHKLLVGILLWQLLRADLGSTMN